MRSECHKYLCVMVVVFGASSPTQARDLTLDAAGQVVFAGLMREHLGGGGLIIAATHAPLRALVCCAGISRAKRTVSRDGSYENAHGLDLFEKIVSVNLVGTFNCIRIAASAIARDCLPS